MSLDIHRDSIIIEEPTIIRALEQNGYELTKQGIPCWYDIDPPITSKVTWVGPYPHMLSGTYFFSLFGAASLFARIQCLEERYDKGSKWLIRDLEELRLTIWNCMAACSTGSLVRKALEANLGTLNQKVVEHGAVPQILNSHFQINPMSDGIDHPTLSTHGPKMIDSKYFDVTPEVDGVEHLGPFDKIVDERLQMKYKEECRKADASLYAAGLGGPGYAKSWLYTETLEEQSRRIGLALQETANKLRAARERERTAEQAKRPQRPVLSAEALLLNHAKDFAALEDKEAAAHNLLGVYNDLVEQELWGAAGTVKNQIGELDYTVVDGFGPGDPARIARSI